MNVARSCGRCYHNSKRSLAIVSTFVLRLTVGESFVETRTQQRGNAEKFWLRHGKRANSIRNWRRSGLKNPDKPMIFIKNNVRNHSYHQFWRRSGLTRFYCSLLLRSDPWTCVFHDSPGRANERYGQDAWRQTVWTLQETQDNVLDCWSWQQFEKGGNLQHVLLCAVYCLQHVLWCAVYCYCIDCSVAASNLKSKPSRNFCLKLTFNE